jgi:hypothetical protein
LATLMQPVVRRRAATRNARSKGGAECRPTCRPRQNAVIRISVPPRERRLPQEPAGAVPMAVPLGHGIVSAAGEGMAAQQTAQGEPASLRQTVTVDGLKAVLGAGGEVATRRRRACRDASLIDADGGQD